MKRFLNWLEKLLPRYAWVPLVCVGGFNALVFWGSRLINTRMAHADLSTALDALIPLVPEAILVYLMAYFTWAANYILIMRDSRKACYRLAVGNCLAKLICLVCFIIIPTTMQRPEVTGSGLCVWLVRFIYWIDPADNLFPSIHCLENWIGWRGMFGCRSIPRWVKACSFLAAILVFASTVLVHQHLLVDIPAGMLAAEIGLLAAGPLMPVLNKVLKGRKT
jgi:membrane-associated phospholipid phosphatase